MENKYRFVFTNGDVVNKKTELGIDDAVLDTYVSRLRNNKPAKFCQIFAWDERANSWTPVKKQTVTITIGCL